MDMQIYTQELLRSKGGWIRSCVIVQETPLQLCSTVDHHCEWGRLKTLRVSVGQGFRVVLETGLDLILEGSCRTLLEGSSKLVRDLQKGDPLLVLKGPMPTEWVGDVNSYSDPLNLDLIYTPFSCPKNFSAVESLLKGIYFSTTLVVLEGQGVPEVVVYGDLPVLKKLQRIWLLFGVIARLKISGSENSLSVLRSAEADFVFECIGLLETVETKIPRDSLVTPFSMFQPIRIKSIGAIGGLNTLSLSTISGYYINIAGVLVTDSSS